MTMILEAVKAKHGDALILTCGNVKVLIDGGERGVYNRFLAKRIEALDSSDEPPAFDLMMVSHVDSDHIAGIIDLTEDIIEAGESELRPPASIRRAWLNTFSDAILAAEIETDRQAAPAQAASLASAYEALGFKFLGAGHTEVMLSSVGQGRTLRRNLKTLHIPINKHFGGQLVLANSTDKPWRMGDLSIAVIGPGKPEIKALKNEWKKKLPKILKKEAEREARSAAAEALDRSVYNLASIVAIAESDNKRILLTGDARWDMIENWLDHKGLTGPQHFEVLKIPHHGATGNVRLSFFERVTADHYVISGDGNHGNPEPDMFEMLFSARGDDSYTIHLTYSPEDIKSHRDFDDPDKLDRVLDKTGWRRSKLKWPGEGEISISVTV